MLGSCQLEASGTEMESRKRHLTSPASTKKDNDTFTTPPAKKLKQARLPFHPLSSSPAQILSPLPPSKKRRISDCASPDPTAQTILKTKDASTPTSGKKSSSKKGDKSSRKVLKPLIIEPPVVETEVTSSSEEPAVKSPVLKKKPKPLEKFLQSAQQPTSTSSDEEVINLIDDEDGSPVILESKKAKDAGVDGEKKDKDTTAARSSSPAVATTVEDGTVQIAEINSLDDEEEEDDAASSVLDSSVGSDGSNNTSMESADGATTQPGNDGKVFTTPKNAAKPPKKTPISAQSLKKQQEKEQQKQEKAKQREEKKLKAEQERAEKKQKAEQEKEEKKRLKEEARLAKEAELKAAKADKEAKAAEAKRQKELEKEQKLKEKQEKLDKEKAAKEEKQRQRVAELEAKAEEKRKKEEEQRKLEEEKSQKNTKQQQMFKSFFKKIETPVAPKEPEVKLCGRFAPIQLQKGFALAPVCDFDKLSKEEDKEKFDEMFVKQHATNLYLSQLKQREITPGRRGKTVLKKEAEQTPSTAAADSMETDEDSIQMVEDVTPTPPPTAEANKSKTKAKLLQFHENHRPAYFGTWTKMSKTITPRNYLKKDEDFLDYEFDSDEEWEEPGESLSDSEGEDEADAGSDAGEESDDGFFVEHGYLSESEDPLDEDESVEQWRARRASKAQAWENELKRQTHVLKPIIIGCFWTTTNQSDNQHHQSKSNRIKLQAYKAVTLVTVPLPIATTHTVTQKEEALAVERTSTPTFGGASSSVGQPKKGPVNKRPVPEEAMPHLIRLVHGNTLGIQGLTREFREFWRLHPADGSDPTTTPASTQANSGRDTPSTDRPRSVSPLPGSPLVSSTTPARSPSVVDSSTSGGPATTGDPSSTNSTPDEPKEIEHTISKRQLDKTISSIGVREKRLERYARICWYVHAAVLEKYGLSDLPVPCQWQHRTGYLAVNNRAVSPQVPVADQNQDALPPQNLSSAPANTARRIVPTKVGPSVMTLLQKQKPAAPKPKPVIPTSGAASILAQAAAMFTTQQQLPGTTQCVLPINQSTTPTTTQNTAVLTSGAVPQLQQPAPSLAEAAESPKPPKKKILTLNSFFGATPAKSPDSTTKSKNSSQIKKEPAASVPAQSVEAPHQSNPLNSSKNTEDSKVVTVSPTTTTTTANGVACSGDSKSGSKKPEIMVLKDLLSKAKVNRMNQQNSPVRKKSPLPTTTADVPAARDGPKIITLDSARDEPEIITLD